VTLVVVQRSGGHITISNNTIVAAKLLLGVIGGMRTNLLLQENGNPLIPKNNLSTKGTAGNGEKGIIVSGIYAG
jgi:hypothetical protein